MKYFLLAILISHFTFSHATPHAGDPRTDTLDIIENHVSLDISDLGSKAIGGYAELTIKVKIANPGYIDLDLLKLIVDSVSVNQVAQSYNYNDTLLRVFLPALAVDDTFKVRVYYHGNPITDASGWGGFYFVNNYAFNLGVGFQADPHNYGRVWHPCWDVFVEKSSYKFSIETAAGDMAVCNGELTSVDTLPSTNLVYHWHLAQHIPSYLASIAVSQYKPAYDIYEGIEDTFPIQLAALPADTQAMKNSFVNLKKAIEIFEESFGPNPFDKVGFVLVPFSSGAMEHPTNIAYPKAAANGSTALETLMAHELAHHWWGDWATTSTDEDMWLNEGWASWSEHRFLEHVYGPQAYKESIRENHELVLHQAHIDDGGYLPIYGIAHEYTYGTHVYKKGADAVHTLRSYMGDAKFFQCIKEFLASREFRDMDHIAMRDYLSNCAQMDLSDYFKDWIINPGFPHFSIDSMKVTGNGPYYVQTFVRQKKHQAPSFYKNVPLDISFFGPNWERVDQNFKMSGECGIYYTVLPFIPEFTALDMNEKISDAITDETNILDASGTVEFTTAHWQLTLNSVTDSAMVRVAHNWVAPDPFDTEIPGVHLSPTRYWKVDGLFDNLDATARVWYDGRNVPDGNLDNELMSNDEDSLLLYYRPHSGVDWTLHPNYIIKVIGSKTDKRGYMDITGIQKGEYAMAMRDAGKASTWNPLPNTPCMEINLSEQKLLNNKPYLEIFPNPARDYFSIRFLRDHDYNRVKVYNLLGEIVSDTTLDSNRILATVKTDKWHAGIYIVEVSSAKKGVKSYSIKIAVQ